MKVEAEISPWTFEPQDRSDPDNELCEFDGECSNGVEQFPLGDWCRRVTIDGVPFSQIACDKHAVGSRESWAEYAARRELWEKNVAPTLPALESEEIRTFHDRLYREYRDLYLRK